MLKEWLDLSPPILPVTWCVYLDLVSPWAERLSNTRLRVESIGATRLKRLRDGSLLWVIIILPTYDNRCSGISIKNEVFPHRSPELAQRMYWETGRVAFAIRKTG